LRARPPGDLEKSLRSHRLQEMLVEPRGAKARAIFGLAISGPRDDQRPF
jgi:hypothetical protein